MGRSSTSHPSARNAVLSSSSSISSPLSRERNTTVFHTEPTWAGLTRYARERSWTPTFAARRLIEERLVQLGLVAEADVYQPSRHAEPASGAARRARPPGVPADRGAAKRRHLARARSGRPPGGRHLGR